MARVKLTARELLLIEGFMGASISSEVKKTLQQGSLLFRSKRVIIARACFLSLAHSITVSHGYMATVWYPFLVGRKISHLHQDQQGRK